MQYRAYWVIRADFAKLTMLNAHQRLWMARKIGDGEWLETLPNGIQTEVGERGGRLSMGQRQLVALMRVLMQKPAIFILDEATANILIAHRLSTVKAADRIVVMEKGRMIEEGNHMGLLEQGGHYATLYNPYFRHQSLDYRPPEAEELFAVKPGSTVGSDKNDDRNV